MSVSASQGADPDLVAALGRIGSRPSTGSAFEVQAIASNGDWAVASAGVVSSDGSDNSTETIAVLSHRVNGSWQLVTDRDTVGFCALLAEAPPDVVTLDERAYFVGCP